jgi:NAD(P)H dehydrogenase (quinone)
MCGRRLRSFFLAQYDLDRSTSPARAAFIARVRAQVARL